MFKRLFRSDRDTNRAITEGLYAEIVAAARQPVFYSAWGVPDTPLGRYEMISLHMVLALRRMAKNETELGEIAQEITDIFFLEVDHSLRELGIGDVGVPKRMKRLAKMYYGRAESYSKSLDAGDAASLEADFLRNVWPAKPGDAEAASLAAYALTAQEHLLKQPAAELRAGKLSFPVAGEITVQS